MYLLDWIFHFNDRTNNMETNISERLTKAKNTLLLAFIIY
ncbi:hypothetical protein ADIARSV_2551 [Arcticibacter svalbardensis MN12-7]|uniref:Uncharacterized protein n=1 Tax=Arcticibacter svalbardensis MN12-7 TaxID=1150600 RepID=R9GRY6_9SPHI|nr:hypothetical protein ADIARSV_2551 [Arcticibacter svalbardensis MN12-7]